MRQGPPKHPLDSQANRYLDELKERLQLPSDYAVAQRLELTPNAVYAMRAGGAMSDATAARLAELLELDPLKVIAATAVDRAHSESERDMWRRIARRAAAALLAAVGVSTPPPPASASQAPSEPASGSPVYYVKSRRRSAGFALALQLLAAVCL